MISPGFPARDQDEEFIFQRGKYMIVYDVILKPFPVHVPARQQARHLFSMSLHSAVGTVRQDHHKLIRGLFRIVEIKMDINLLFIPVDI